MRGTTLRLTLVLAVSVLALVGAAAAVSGLVLKKADTLIFAGASDPTYLDPALVSDGESFRITEQIFEGLVALKPGSTVIMPALAKKWSSKNGKDWVFQLRKATFHDNTAFNAKAVCYNFDRQYNFTGPFQDASATYYWQTVFLGFHHNASADLSPSLYKSCTTKGNYTATIHLAKRSSSFLAGLVISSFGIQSPTALKKYGADQGEIRNGTFYPTGSYAFSHPTGTGPFQFESWKVGESVSITRFSKYWGKKAKLARIIVRPIANNTARVQALQTGEIYGADLIQPQDVPTIQSNNNLKLLNRPAFNVAYVTIHQGPGSPMNDIKVRQAVAYGLDRAGVIGSFYAGRGQVAQEFQPPKLFGWTNKVPKYPYNPTKAKELLNSSSCHVPCKVEFWYPTGVSRPYMPDPKRNFEAFSASLEVRLQRHREERTVAAGLRQARQRRHRRRPEPDRLDRRLRRSRQLPRDVLQDVRPVVRVPQPGDLQHPGEGGCGAELQEARRPLPAGEHHDHEVPACRSVCTLEAGTRLPEAGERLRGEPRRN